jgi:hypothetical protein
MTINLNTCCHILWFSQWYPNTCSSPLHLHLTPDLYGSVLRIFPSYQALDDPHGLEQCPKIYFREKFLAQIIIGDLQNKGMGVILSSNTVCLENASFRFDKVKQIPYWRSSEGYTLIGIRQKERRNKNHFSNMKPLETWNPWFTSTINQKLYSRRKVLGNSSTYFLL